MKIKAHVTFANGFKISLTSLADTYSDKETNLEIGSYEYFDKLHMFDDYAEPYYCMKSFKPLPWKNRFFSKESNYSVQVFAYVPVVLIQKLMDEMCVVRVQSSVPMKDFDKTFKTNPVIIECP